MPQETAPKPARAEGPRATPEPTASERMERVGRAFRRAAKNLSRLAPRAFLPRAGRGVRKHARTLALLGVVAVACLPPWLDRRRAGSARVLAGVRLGAVSLSHLDRGEVERLVAARAAELEHRKLGVRLAEKRFAVEPAALGFRVDVAETTRRALAVGRDESVPRAWLGYFRRWFSPAEVPLAARTDAPTLRARVDAWGAEAITDPPFFGGIELGGGVARPLPPRAGRRLSGAALETLTRAFVAGAPGEVELPLLRVPAPLPADAADEAARVASALIAAKLVLRSTDPPAEIAFAPSDLAPALRAEPDGKRLALVVAPDALERLVAPLRKGIEREPVDAKFVIDPAGPITIQPSQPGLRIVMERLPEALLAAASNPDRAGVLPLVAQPDPALSTERATALGIKGLVSSFTTRHPCCERRVENIHRIADLLDGRVVEPGQTVSVNELVGPRTLKAGFVLAPTIEEGEMVDSVGGGISQFATTFFNALFHGGYDIIERQPHSYWFPRYPMGHEATLSWPKPDIIFKNDTAAGLLIKTHYTAGSISVKLYGDNGGRKVRAEVSGRQNAQPAPVELLPNPGVPPDEERVKEPGSIGWSVIVSRIVTFADGTKKEERRRVTYKQRPKRVEVHPCRIPEGEKGYTGEKCPEPADVEELEDPETVRSSN